MYHFYKLCTISAVHNANMTHKPPLSHYRILTHSVCNLCAKITHTTYSTPTGTLVQWYISSLLYIDKSNRPP